MLYHNNLLFVTKLSFLVTSIGFGVVAFITYLKIITSGGYIADLFNGYLIFWELTVSVISFAIYLLLHAVDLRRNKKRVELDTYKIDRLVEFGKAHGELITLINNASCIEDFDKLGEAVNKYNADADDFFIAYGVTPKKITFLDYEGKRESFLRSAGEQK